MFSLITTLLAVLLAVAAALAALYYGSEAVTQSVTSAKATKLANQGQQLLAAAEMFRTHEGRYPDTLDELITPLPDGTTFLRGLPVAGLSSSRGVGMSSALAADKGMWTMPVKGVPLFVLHMAEDPVTCATLNKLAHGVESIAKAAYTARTAQCLGSSYEALSYVIAKDGTALRRGFSNTVAGEPPSAIADPEAYLTPPKGLEAQEPNTPARADQPLTVTASNLRFVFPVNENQPRRVVSASIDGSCLAQTFYVQYDAFILEDSLPDCNVQPYQLQGAGEVYVKLPADEVLEVIAARASNGATVTLSKVNSQVTRLNLSSVHSSEGKLTVNVQYRSNDGPLLTTAGTAPVLQLNQLH